ncbi:hypothetical protein V5N11_008355 [Cardamine amara subsp. amara]|uniref:DUF4283 domain-containing protein n=1 Tax=Cardamine amara subsp. amara TaxID=228776 RepID=A0ABD1BCC5_CARAN
MALNHRRSAPRHFALGLADPQIAVSQTTYAVATDNNRRSLVGRVLSPRRQDLYSVIARLPDDWNVDGSKCHGRIIGGGKFQFVFDEERDLEMVLWSGPYTYNGWLVVLQKWEDEPGHEFLQFVPMWLRIRGIPIRYLCDGTVRKIASSMGEVMESRCDDSLVDLRSVRCRVNVSVNTRLCFKKVVTFDSGEVKIVSLRYEDVAWNKARFKFCGNCGALNHLAKSCLVAWVDVPDPNDRSLSPPLHESSSDGSVENNNGEGGSSSEPADASANAVQDLPDGDGEEQQKQGLDGDVMKVQSEMVGTSSEGSKRKFDSVEQADDIVEKRLRGSTDGSGDNLNPLQEE